MDGSPCNEWEINSGHHQNLEMGFYHIRKYKHNPSVPYPCPPPHTRPSLPSLPAPALPLPPLSHLISARLNSPMRSSCCNSGSRSSMRSWIISAMKSNSTTRQRPSHSQHAQEAPPLYSGYPALSLARADVTCAPGPAFSASAAWPLDRDPWLLQPLSPPGDWLWVCNEHRPPSLEDSRGRESRGRARMGVGLRARDLGSRKSPRV